MFAAIKLNKQVLIDYLVEVQQDLTKVPVRATDQQALLYAQAASAGDSAFNICLQFAADKPLPPEVLNWFVEQLGVNHDQLRAFFEAVNGQVYQRFNTVATVDVTHHHCDSKEVAGNLLDQLKQTVFDLNCWPLWRVDTLCGPQGEQYLSLVFHHSIFDGHSIGLMLNDIKYITANTSARYADVVLSQNVAKPADMKQYLQQLSEYDSIDWQDVFGYTQQNLSAQASVKAPISQLYRFALDNTVQQQIERLSVLHGITPFALKLFITGVLLSVYSDNRQLILFTPQDQRASDQKQVIGNFVNLMALPLTIDLMDTPSAFLAKQWSGYISALDKGALNYDSAVLHIQNQTQADSRVKVPLISALVAQQTHQSNTIELGNTRLDYLAASVRPVKYPFVLNVISSEQGETLEWEVDPLVISAANVAQMNRHWLAVLDVLQNPQQSLFTGLNTVFFEQYQSTNLNRLRAAGQDFSVSNTQSIVSVFEHCAHTWPDNIALSFDTQQLSYAQLNAQVNRVAHALRALGVSDETKVIVSLPRGFQLLISILAVLKAGGTYVPVDIAAPEQRKIYCSEDCGAQWIICDDLWQVATQVKTQIKRLAVDDGFSKSYSSENPSWTVNANQAAYIIYTSGSTGLPKGVVVEHHSVLRLMTSASAVFDFKSDDVWCLFHSYAFDFAVWEIFGALLTGGTLCIVPSDTPYQPAVFHRFLFDNIVTVLNQTPSAFYTLMNADSSADETLECLRYVVFGGEALSLPKLKPWFDKYPSKSTQLVNMYGITETTVHVTYHRITEQDCAYPRSTIGQPLPDLSIWLLGVDGVVLPQGVKGEMYVSGPGVAREYFGQDEMTAARFFAHPSHGHLTGKMYRSGDFARFDSVKNLEYLGRKDDQVKIRGYRIELEEIRQQLMALPGVKQSVVVVDDINGVDKILAFIVPPLSQQPSQHFNESDCKQQLASQLPPYMVPSIYHQIESIPQTNNGKADIKRLLADHKTLIAPSLESRTQDNTLASQLCAKAAFMLGLKQLGPDDNLFSMGLDSISCIRFVNEARSLGLTITVGDIYRHLSISALLQITSSQSVAQTLSFEALAANYLSSAEKQLVKGNITSVYPLTQLQLGMVYYSQLNPEHNVYHDVFSYRLQLTFDEQKLGEALAFMVRQHPILSTVFIDGPQRPLQATLRHANVPLQFIDLSASSQDEAGQKQQINDFIAGEINNDFAGQEQVLYRLFIHHLGDGTCQFTLSFHHAIFDGWSVSQFNAQLLRTYQGLLKGESLASEPVVTAHYGDYVFAELQALEDQDCWLFWQSQLTGTQVCQLPEVSSPAGEPQQSMEHLDSVVFAQSGEAIKQLAKVNGVSVRQLMLSLHLKTLSLLLNQNRVNTTVVYNNRQGVEGGDVQLGLFLNSLPFDITFEATHWGDLFAQVMALDNQIMGFRQFPAAEIQKRSGLDFQSILFNYTHFQVYDQLLDSGGVELLDQTVFESVNFPLTIDCGVSVGSQALRYQVGFEPKHYSKQSAQRYIQTVDALCQHALNDVTAPLPNWSEVLKEEAQQVLAAGQYCQAKSGDEVTFADRGEHCALVFGSTKMSYGQLADQVECVAQTLGGLQIAPGSRVALHLDKSIDYVVCLLACLQREFCIIPLATDMDTQRKSAILAQAKPQYLLSSTGGSNSDEFGFSALNVTLPGLTLSQNLANSKPATDFAVVMFTSGTTGKPKGVVLKPLALMQHCRSMASQLELSAQDRVLWFSSIGADISLEQILSTLLAGATLVIPETLWSMSDFFEQVAAHQVTVADLPPVYCQWLFRENVTIKHQSLNSNIRTVIMGGETFPVSVINAWQNLALCNKIKLFNAYGPTEATITSALYEVPPMFDGQQVPLGQPTAGNQLWLLDDNMRPVPAGVPGQLYIGGDHLAAGYLDEPQKTAEAFICATVLSKTSRLYRTGDVCQFNGAGELLFGGRNDDQVKIRGHRVELDQIKQCIERIECVNEAVVLVQTEAQNKQLIAFVVLNANSGQAAQIKTASIKTELMDILPSYMLPHRIEAVDDLPLTNNGKVDKRQLLAGLQNLDSQRMDHNCPLAGLALQVAQVWQQVLGQMPTSGTDGFYQLGGDSLAALRVLSQLKETFGVSIKLHDFLANATVDGTALLLSKKSPSKNSLSEDLLCLRQNGNQPVVVCLPGAGGLASDFIPLSEQLGQFTVYALQPLGLNDSSQLPQNSQQVVAHAMQQLQQLQLQPVLLIGHSMGGWTATELRRQYCPDAQLLLLDSYPSVTNTNPVEQKMVALVQQKLTAFNIDLPQSDGIKSLANLIDQLAQLNTSTADIDLWLNLLKVTHAQLNLSYEVRHPMGKLTLVNASDTIAQRGLASEAWAAVDSLTLVNSTVKTVEATHFNLMTREKSAVVANIIDQMMTPQVLSEHMQNEDLCL